MRLERYHLSILLLPSICHLPTIISIYYLCFCLCIIHLYCLLPTSITYVSPLIYLYIYQSIQFMYLSSIYYISVYFLSKLSLCSSSWPLTPDLPASASLVVRLQVCIAMTSYLGISLFSYLMMGFVDFSLGF